MVYSITLLIQQYLISKYSNNTIVSFLSKGSYKCGDPNKYNDKDHAHFVQMNRYHKEIMTLW